MKSTSAARLMTRDQLLRRDSIIVETCIMGHCLFLMLEQIQGLGLEVRPDIMHYVNLASVTPMSDVDVLSVSRLARRIEDASKALLRDMSVSDPRDGLYVVAMFILKLVDENLCRDPKNQAVLASLLLIEDLKDVNETSTWRFEEKRLKHEAGKLLSKARLLALFI